MIIIGGVGGVEKLFTPTLSSVTNAAGGFTFTITNYSALNTYVLTPSSGSASEVSGTVTLSGLGNNVSASVVVQATRVGYEDSDTATASGTSLPALSAPTFSATTATAGGFTATITNYDAANSYTATTTAGSVSSITSSTVTQTGLGNSASATVTVTASRSGYVSASASFSGTSQSKLATPTFSGSTATSGGWTATITNYDSSNTYTLSVNSGSISRSGSGLTASGLGNGASSTATVSASRSGFVSSDNGLVSGTAIPACSSCTFSYKATEGGNCGTCNIFGNTHIVCYDIFFYTGSPNPCIGCNAAIGSWYECVGTCCAVCGTYC
jgi:hypothetical protein